MVRLPWYHGVIFLMFVALVAVSIGYYDQRRRLRTLTERQERDRRSVAGAPGSGDEANNCMHLSPYDHCLRRCRRYVPRQEHVLMYHFCGVCRLHPVAASPSECRYLHAGVKPLTQSATEAVSWEKYRRHDLEDRLKANEQAVPQPPAVKQVQQNLMGTGKPD